MNYVPLINVTGVSVNTTSNLATLTLDGPLPNSGRFKLRFCNNAGGCPQSGCISACDNPQARVQFSYTPSGGSATVYANVYTSPCCCCSNPDTVKLSQIVKQAARCCGIVNGNSGYGTTGAVFITDCLPCANVSYTTTTSATASAAAE